MVDDNPVLSYFGTFSIFPYIPRVGEIKNVFFRNPCQANRMVRFLMHAAPWILLLIKIVLTMKENGVTDNT